MNEITNWLDQTKIVKYPSNKQFPYLNDIELYYTSSEIRKFLNKKSELYIPEDTRRYEADNLFKNLINYSIKYKMYDLDNRLLFNTKNKNSFYKFIYENSSKLK